MAAKITKVTRKGQVTVPAEIRKALDIGEGDVLVVEQREKEIVLTRQGDVVDWTSGYLHQYARGKHLSPDEIRETARDAIADQVGAEIE